jgi:ABC-type branched-subunit amino acid transport system ATPase component
VNEQPSDRPPVDSQSPTGHQNGVTGPEGNRIAALEGAGILVQFGGVRAVNNVDLQLRSGTVHGLIGPNGAGKTTLFDALSGITRPTKGRVLLAGRDITKSSIAVRARAGVRRTFQRQQTFGWLSVHDNLLVAMEWTTDRRGAVRDLVRWPGRIRVEAERRQRVDEVLDLCGIGDRRHIPVGSLSIGELRLVEIGRAIVDHPAVLLLDEPTSGLQHAEVERVGNLVRQIVEETDCAVGLVEHDVGFVMSLCDYITVMNLGSVIAAGTSAEIRSSAIVAEAYLGA